MHTHGMTKKHTKVGIDLKKMILWGRARSTLFFRRKQPPPLAPRAHRQQENPTSRHHHVLHVVVRLVLRVSRGLNDYPGSHDAALETKNGSLFLRDFFFICLRVFFLWQSKRCPRLCSKVVLLRSLSRNDVPKYGVNA